MRHVLYVIILATTVMFPCAVLGITAHFQSTSMRYGHGLQSPFSYIIAIACFTIITVVGHLSALVLDLDAAVSGVVFRKNLAELQPIMVILLTCFWLGVVFVLALRLKMEFIGGCPYIPPAGYVSNPQICTEWYIVLGFAIGTTLVFPAMYYANIKLNARDAFVSGVWKYRQYRANKAKRRGAPPQTLVRGGAAQLPPTAPLPPLASASQTAANPPAGQQLQPPVVSQWGAAPPTYLDIEATAGFSGDTQREASSDPMTSPASPPPSALPSWVR